MHKNVQLSVGYFPPYKQWYVSADSDIDDYLSGGNIVRGRPTYYDTERQANTAITNYKKAHKKTKVKEG